MGLRAWIKRNFSTVESSDGLAAANGNRSGESGVEAAGGFDAAIEFHRQGDLDRAERLYRNILRSNPDDVPTLHLLGTLHAQKGNAAEAAKCLEPAARLSSRDPDILTDLARVRVMQGRSEEAESLLRGAIELSPDEAGRHFALAQTMIQRGEPARAVDSFSRAVQLDPGFIEAYSDLGAACLEIGAYDAAKEAFGSAIRLDEKYSPARLNLAHLYFLLGEFDQAESQYLALLDADPTNDQALVRLAKVYALRGENKNALECYEDLVARSPGKTELWNQLGAMAQKLELLPKAAESFEHSLAIDASQPETLTNLGVVYGLSGKLEQSATCFESAIALRDDLESAYHNLGATYISQGRHEEAFEAYEKALKLAPHSHITLSNLIGINQYRRHADRQDMRALIERYLKSIAPERIIATIPPIRDRSPKRRLKVGYVSPNFVQHSVSYFIGPAIAGHDRTRFEVFCYSDVARADKTTERLKSAADHWRQIYGKSHDSFAAQVRQDEIDILIDLNGHCANNRLPAFAQKPAPVQITYLGYPAITGLPEMDYRLTDPIADPPGEPASGFAETLVRFPQAFLCYEPPESAPPVPTVRRTPATVCFGSFNELPKLSPEVVRTWSAILARVPGSTLLLKARAFADEGTCARVANWFHDAGIEDSRVELLSRTPSLEAHLALYARVDIALDTFPYNGTTTTCEALYMGVPVLTLLGDAHVSRVGASLLTAIGLASLIADSNGAYIEKAISLANDLPARIRLRETLRSQVLASPLTDKERFIHNLESIYAEAWQSWCDTDPPSNAQDAPPEMAPVGNITGAVRLNTADSHSIWLPSDLNRFMTYVHCEQEAWFEDEFDFVRVYLDKGMRVVDIGANYGVYTLLAADRIGSTGCVWSIEPASTTYRWLNANVRYNACEIAWPLNVALSNFNGVMKLQVFEDSEHNRLSADESQHTPGELVDVRRLDSCVVDKEISNIDFVKIDAEGAEKQILDGGLRFFTDENPLVMFEIKSGIEQDWSLAEKFQTLGYSVFRLVPGLGCLAPIYEAEALDSYMLNLFACRRERLGQLSERGLVISQLAEKLPVWSADEELVWDYFERQAFCRDLSGAWRSHFEKLDTESRKTLLRVFGRYVTAHEDAVSPADAYALLASAYQECVHYDTGNFNPALRMVGARLATELGLRANAVKILDSLLGFEHLRGEWCLQLPFLPASPNFDQICAGSNVHDWCEASVIDAFVRLLAYSTYFLDADALELLERLRETGFERPEMERRRQLLSARLGKKTQEPSERLRRASADNLNPKFWQQFRTESPHRVDAS